MVQFYKTGHFGISGCQTLSSVKYSVNGNTGSDGVLCCDNSEHSLCQPNSAFSFKGGNKIVITVSNKNLYKEL